MASNLTADEPRRDEYDEYDYNLEKEVHLTNSGKSRSKKEASLNTNRADTSGHTRKILTKLVNTEK